MTKPNENKSEFTSGSVTLFGIVPATTTPPTMVFCGIKITGENGKEITNVNALNPKQFFQIMENIYNIALGFKNETSVPTAFYTGNANDKTVIEKYGEKNLVNNRLLAAVFARDTQERQPASDVSKANTAAVSSLSILNQKCKL